MTPFKALALISISLGLFWFGIARLFTDDRRVLVPLFVVVALLAALVLAIIQGGADPEEVGP